MNQAFEKLDLFSTTLLWAGVTALAPIGILLLVMGVGGLFTGLYHLLPH